MDASTTASYVTGIVDDIETVLSTALPDVLTLFGLLLGLGLAIYYVRKFIARRK